MPLLVINERVSSDLAALSRLPSKEYVSEFCRQALEALGAGAKRAALKQAAQLLSLDLDTVSGAVMALSLLFVEAAKVRSGAALCPHPGAPSPLTAPTLASLLCPNAAQLLCRRPGHEHGRHCRARGQQARGV